ncbi:hypothetical protein RhiirA5_418032 [Rhizophagus irregularis]|uniref:Uncharacterized protein n=1 Tax=Rhizophagus irregularis TaxID=588596 RepID=A0A2N0PL46_9GLOM|nr:hypothetical protein RhiirA5_418032 [Rhizophagus irregularis]
MTEVKVYTYGNRMKYNLEQYFECFVGMEYNHLMDFYNIDKLEDDEKFSLVNYEEKHLREILFLHQEDERVSFNGSFILYKVGKQNTKEKYWKRYFEETKLSLEKDLEDKTRLIKLKEEEINELKEKIKEMEVTAKE